MPSNRHPAFCQSVKRESCILAFTCLAIFINLVAIIFGVYVMTGLKPPANSQTSHSLDDNMGTIACISCDLESGDLLLKSLTQKDNGTERLCCAENSSQMSTLMELMLRRPEMDQPHQKRQSLSDFVSPDSINPDDLSFSKASAHKRLLPAEMFDSSKNPVPVMDRMVPLKLNASHHDQLTEHARDVTVMESGFQIVHPGTYLIYSNVRFQPDSSQPCSSFRFKVWEHKVFKTSTDKMRHEILKSVHTCCDNCTKDRETSFAGGAFILNTDEHLSVEVSGLGLIAYNHQSSYFGLMMLGASEVE